MKTIKWTCYKRKYIQLKLKLLKMDNNNNNDNNMVNLDIILQTLYVPPTVNFILL